MVWEQNVLQCQESEVDIYTFEAEWYYTIPHKPTAVII